MSNPNIPEPQLNPEPDESFDDILSQFEQSHSRKAEDGSKQIEGTVIAVSAESVFLDIGFKSEGILPLAAVPELGRDRKARRQVAGLGQGPRSRWLLRAFPRQDRAAERLVVAGEGLRRESDHRGHGHGRCQRRPERGRGSARLHAGLAQRSARRRRNGEVGRAGNPLPHYQARRHGRRRGRGPPRRCRRGRALGERAPLLGGEGRRDGATARSAA